MWSGVVVGVLGIVVELLVVGGVLLLVVVSGPGPLDIFQFSLCARSNFPGSFSCVSVFFLCPKQ